MSRFCTNCGEEILPNVKFCNKCGQQIFTYTTVSLKPEKEKKMWIEKCLFGVVAIFVLLPALLILSIVFSPIALVLSIIGIFKDEKKIVAIITAIISSIFIALAVIVMILVIFQP